MEYSNNPRSPTGRGPHRRKDLTQRILNAALELMVEEGYGSCSVDAISAMSGVAKPTIYRRYANRHEIALAALEQRLEIRPVPNYGDLETDLRAMIAEMLRGVIEGGGSGHELLQDVVDTHRYDGRSTILEQPLVELEGDFRLRIERIGVVLA